MPLDTIDNIFLLLAAYCLFIRDDRFKWRTIIVGTTLLPAVAISLMLPYVIPFVFDVTTPNNQFWKMIYASPNLLMAQAGLLGIGIGSFIEPTTRAVRLPLLIIFCIYAILQFPNYYFSLIQEIPNRCKEISPLPPNCGSIDIIRMFNGAAKIALLFAFSAVALSFSKILTTELLVRGTKLCLWLLSLGLTAFVFFYRVIEVAHHLATR